MDTYRLFLFLLGTIEGRRRQSGKEIPTMGEAEEGRNSYKEEEIKKSKGEKKQNDTDLLFFSISLSSLSISFVYLMFICIFCYVAVLHC